MKIFGAFSLIELMVVIAIVAILAALALPAYKVYVIKTKLSGIVSVMSGPMKSATVYFNRNGTFPPGTVSGNDPGYAAVGLTSYASLNSSVIDGVFVNNSCTFSPYPTSFCMAVAINANMFPEGGQRQLYFIGRQVNGVVTWYCVSPTLGQTYAIPDVKYLPSGCSY